MSDTEKPLDPIDPPDDTTTTTSDAPAPIDPPDNTAPGSAS